MTCALALGVAAHDDHEHSLHDEQPEEPNFHKRMVLSLVYKTGGDQAFAALDAFMRPLSFTTQALLSTVFISAVPIFLIYALNLLCTGASGASSDKRRESFTKVMLAFAMGGLLGDVFFHTIPHLGHDSHHNDSTHGNSGGHSHSEEDMQIYLVLIAGIWAFFLIEKFTHEYFSDSHNHDHDHSVPSSPSKENRAKAS